MIILTCWHIALSRQFDFSCIHVVVWLVIAGMIVNVVWSVHPFVTQVTAWKSALGLWAFLLLVTKCKEQVWHFLINSLIATTLIATVWALTQYSFDFGRVSGPQIDVNAFAAIVYCGSFLFLFKKITNDVSHQRLYLILQLLMLSAMMATFSRSGIFTWGVGVAVALLFCIRFPSGLRPLISYLCLALIAYLFVKLLPLAFGTETISRNFNDIGSLNARIPQWQAAWEMFLSAPFTGTGFGTFKLLYPPLRAEWASAGNLVHNDYLQLLHEGGIFFFMAFMGWMLFHLYLLIRLFLTKPNLSECSFSKYIELAGLLIINLMLFMQASINFIFYIDYLNFVSGVIFARIIWISVKLNLLKKPVIKPVRPIVRGFLTLFVVFLWVKLALSVLPHIIFHEKILPITLSEKQRSSLANTILSIDPANAPASEVLVQNIYRALPVVAEEKRQKIFETVWAQALIMHERTPVESRYLYWLGILSKMAVDLKLTLPFAAKPSNDYHQKAIDLNPGYFPSLIELAKTINKNQGPIAALTYLTAVFDRWHSVAPVPETLALLKIMWQLAKQAELPEASFFYEIYQNLLKWNDESTTLRSRYKG